MAEVAEADASLFTNRSDPAAASDFVDRVRQRLDDAQEEDPTLPDLRRIGAVLGIGPEACDTEEAPQSEDKEATSE